MKRKVLVFDPQMCTGCMYCMTACATYHEGRTSLSRARLQIVRHEGHAVTRIDEEDELVFILVSCQHCVKPICSDVCPAEAIRTDTETGAVIIDYSLCVGCRTCQTACFFGAISFNEEENKVYKCDLCGGDPQCVKFCHVGALKFVPIEAANLSKKMKAAGTIMRGLVKQTD